MSIINKDQLSEIISLISKELGASPALVIENFKKSLEQLKENTGKEKKVSEKTCSYVYQRGSKKGARCSFINKDGSNYCSRHCKKSDDKKKDKNVNKKVEAVKNMTKLMKNKSSLEIKKNKYDKFETQNNLLYDLDTREIYGYQYPDGKARDLTKNEIQWCKENNLKFRYPFNLSLDQSCENESENESEEKEYKEQLEAEDMNEIDYDDDVYEEDIDDMEGGEGYQE